MKLTAAVFLLTAASSVVCGQTPQPELITSVSLESVEKLLQGMGFECTWDKDQSGKLKDYFLFRAEGYKIVVKVPSPGYIWLFNVFTDKLPLDAVNEWNRTNNFSHAYIDKNQDLYFETDIIVRGGVTRDNVEAQIKEFRDQVAKWARFVVNRVKQSAPNESVKP